MNNLQPITSVLSIAGSDPSGGAGIQTDIKTCTLLGVNPMTAITAITAQNTTGVSAVMPVSPDILRAQLDAVLQDIAPGAVKTGMIPSRQAVEVTVEAVNRFSLGNIVVDPIMVATSGDSLSNSDSRRAMLDLLLPVATVATPNIPEAEVLSGLGIKDREQMIRAAERIQGLTGCSAILIKGGHSLQDGSHADLLYMHDSSPLWLEHPHIDTANTHGTGCTLSSAIASLLTRQLPISEAVGNAVAWLSHALISGAGSKFGHGHGPAVILPLKQQ